MEKNSFFIFNDIMYELHSCSEYEDLKLRFLPRLKILIPYSYASILAAELAPDSETIQLHTPICCPDYFSEAEEEYIHCADEDHLLWLLHRRESGLIRESDLIPEDSRLNNPLYLRCYQKYDIYDTLQYSIIYQQQLLGVLTLFRTRIDGLFSDDDMFFLRSLGTHLNLAMYRISSVHSGSYGYVAPSAMDALSARYLLTSRESEIVRLLLQFSNLDEISARLQIRENTIQKHMQNSFRKMNISSRWELLRLFAGVQP